MIRNLTFTVCSLAVMTLATSARAQDAVLSEFYGRGVHQYFSGDMSQANESLSAAIDGGSRDPRTYYFRGLAALRQGQTYMAEMDFQTAASLENADVNGVYQVGKALERIQGANRRTLERYRSLARVEAQQRQSQRDAARYEQWKRNEKNVLRDPQFAPATGTQPKAAPLVPPPAAVPPAEKDPFADEVEKPAAKAAAPTEEMPVGDDAADTILDDTPAAKDDAEEMKDDLALPGATTTDAGAEEAEMPAEDAPAKEDDDPFGEPDEPKKDE